MVPPLGPLLFTVVSIVKIGQDDMLSRLIYKEVCVLFGNKNFLVSVVVYMRFVVFEYDQNEIYRWIILDVS